VEENIDVVASDQKERMGSPLAGPGIMLLTASMRLLYKDRRAGELCQQIVRCQDGKTANGVLPPAVVSLVNQIQKILTVRTDPKDWEQIQLRCVVNTLHSSVLLCGTALIDQSNAEKRILIVISEVGIGAWQDKVLVRAKETFHLTLRETTVVQHLLKGWSNKEIANRLNLSLHTVETHRWRIMEKDQRDETAGAAFPGRHRRQ